MTSGSASTGSDFFAALREDHARIETCLKSLDRVARAANPVEGAPALAIVAETLQFFATEGARHEEHEERTLFPRLRGRAEFNQILSAFEFQHRMNATETRALAECAQRAASTDGRDLRRLAGRFADMQRGHMVAEERALFDLAAARLAPAEIAAMSAELHARRSAVVSRR